MNPSPPPSSSPSPSPSPHPSPSPFFLPPQGRVAINNVDLGIYSFIFLVVWACTFRQFFCRGIRLPWASQQVFHAYLSIFASLRLGRSLFTFTWSGDAALWFLFGRGASLFFDLSFMIVGIFLSVETFSLVRKIVLAWRSFWVLTFLCVGFLFFGTLYYVYHPDTYNSRHLFYNLSIDIANALCFWMALVLMAGGCIMIQRLKKANRISNQKGFEEAIYKILGVTFVTVILTLGRFFCLLYRPIFRRHMNEWVFFIFSYWLPEFILSILFLFMMKSVVWGQKNDPRRTQHEEMVEEGFIPIDDADYPFSEDDSESDTYLPKEKTGLLSSHSLSDPFLE